MHRYVDATDQGVHLMPARDLLKTNWDVPQAHEQGFMRTICRGYMGSGSSLALGVILFGQRSPSHTPNAEHQLLILEGEITWEVEGAGTFVTGPMDLLFIGAGQTYVYWNSGPDTARFVDVLGKLEKWPHSSMYDGVEANEITQPEGK
jgi:mannose-6-phosphate isomerase-like protein (cupin superfamily)